MTLAEDLEDQLRASLRERHIAEFVDLAQTPLVASLHQLMNEAGPRWQAARPSARQTCVFPVPDETAT